MAVARIVWRAAGGAWRGAGGIRRGAMALSGVARGFHRTVRAWRGWDMSPMGGGVGVGWRGAKSGSKSPALPPVSVAGENTGKGAGTTGVGALPDGWTTLIPIQMRPTPPPPVFPSQMAVIQVDAKSGLGQHLKQRWTDIGGFKTNLQRVEMSAAVFMAHRAESKMGEEKVGEEGKSVGGEAAGGEEKGKKREMQKLVVDRLRNKSGPIVRLEELQRMRVERVGVTGKITSVDPDPGQDGMLNVWFRADLNRQGLVEKRVDEQGFVVCRTEELPEIWPESHASYQSDPKSNLHVEASNLQKLVDQMTSSGGVSGEMQKELVELQKRYWRQLSMQNSQLPEFEALQRKFNELLRYELADPSKMMGHMINSMLWVIPEQQTSNVQNAEKIVGEAKNSVLRAPFFMATYCTVPMEEGKENPWQALLNEDEVVKRIRLALDLVEREVKDHEVRQKITSKVEEKIQDSHRQFVAREQYKQLRKELGYDKDEKSSLVEKFRDKVDPKKTGKVVPEAITKVIDEEIDKLSGLEPHSSEFGVTRNYLEWLTAMPWGLTSEEKLAVDPAREILEEDHYGMSDVKERILEFIAVSNMRGSSKGTILCLHGPPGVGKTSIGKSVAKALGRQFYRFSVGGLGDVAEIKGHRRTYIGAMPGKMMQALKVTERENPLVLIDEIDKIGSRAFANGGDPGSALLELLDPEQNGSFVDHYLDVPVDLSRVLFMCTANSLDTITGPLRDRMEVITLNGYIAEEKVEIARRFLAKQAREKTGLVEGDIDIDDEALKVLVRDYAREAGVRNLGSLVDKVHRKVAFKIVKSREAEKAAAVDGDTFMEAITRRAGRVTWTAPEPLPLPFKVTLENLESFVGKPTFDNDPLYALPPPGVITGLAYTSMGGDVLYIETANLGGEGVNQAEAKGGPGGVEDATASVTSVLEEEPKKKSGSGGLGIITGHLGQVMKESSSIAHTFATAFASQHLSKSAEAVMRHDRLHLHVPTGAIPKDGPSAGVTMVTAMLSTAMGVPVRPALSMTGEVSLTGRVLPVGGIKEKCIAARRHPHVTEVILPRANRKDWDELPDHIKKDLTVHFADTYANVFDVAFPGVERRGSNEATAAPAA